MLERIEAELNDVNLADYVLRMGLKNKITDAADSIRWTDNIFYSGEIYVYKSGKITIEFTNLEGKRASVYNALDYMLGMLSEEEQSILKVLVDDAIQIAKSKQINVIKSRQYLE